MFFERFNVAGFSILERPMAQLYASNALNGLVIDLGYHWTDISAIYDGFLLKHARASTPVGVRACLAFLTQVLKTNSSLASTLSPPDNPLSPEALHQAFKDLASTLYNRGLIKPPVLGSSQLVTGEVEEEGVVDIASILAAGKERAVIEANIKRRANQKASAAEQAKFKEIEALDLITLEFNGKEVTVGKERHRFCDPLFDPRVLKHVPGLEAILFGHSEKEKDLHPVLSVSEAASHVLSRTEVDQRQYILGSPLAAGGLLVTGDMTSNVKGGADVWLRDHHHLLIGFTVSVGMGAFFAVLLGRYIVQNPEQHLMNDIQPKSIRVLKLPEFYSEYREKGEGYAAFLGSSIVAKVGPSAKTPVTVYLMYCCTFFLLLKVTFHESHSRSFVTKAEYGESGPSAIVGMSPALF